MKVFFVLLFSVLSLGSEPKCGDMYAKIIEEFDPSLKASLTQRQINELTDNFMSTHYKMLYGGGDISRWNDAVFSYLKKIPFIDRKLSKRKAGLNSLEQKLLLAKVENHPVVTLCKVKTYDPSGKLGFCFGRAASVHIEAIRIGIQKEMIQKI